jgi:hypothetical protein
MIKRILKNWKTSSIGIIALIGLGVNVYNNGLSVSDFLLLVIGVGFIAAKDKKTDKLSPGVGGEDPDDDDEEADA